MAQRLTGARGATGAAGRPLPVEAAHIPERAEAHCGTPEMIPVVNETSERVVRTLVIGLPPVALVCAGWLAWGGALHWQDLVVLALMYTLSGLSVTVGFHRLFTHRSFKTSRARCEDCWPWLAPIALGEGWHDNHHAFPTSARRGPGAPAARDRRCRGGRVDPESNR
jgi:Fatty acid desaturase